MLKPDDSPKPEQRTAKRPRGRPRSPPRFCVAEAWVEIADIIQLDDPAVRSARGELKRFHQLCSELDPDSWPNPPSAGELSRVVGYALANAGVIQLSNAGKLGTAGKLSKTEELPNTGILLLLKEVVHAVQSSNLEPPTRGGRPYNQELADAVRQLHDAAARLNRDRASRLCALLMFLVGSSGPIADPFNVSIADLFGLPRRRLTPRQRVLELSKRIAAMVLTGDS